MGGKDLFVGDQRVGFFLGANSGARGGRDLDEKLCVNSVFIEWKWGEVCTVQSKWGGKCDVHAWKRLQGFGWCGPNEIWALGIWAWAQ